MANWTVSYGRYVQLKVTATEIEVDTANNRSKVRVQSSIYYPGGTSARNAYPQTLKVSVNGTSIGTQSSITYSLSTSSRTKTLNTYTSGYITHNSDGSKSVNVNVSITDNAGDTGRVNQTLVLTKIARASSLTSFSIGAHLKNSTANTVKLAISRQSTSFTHDIQLRDGSTVIQSWNGQGAPTSLTLSSSSVNTLLKRMSSVTSKTLTLRVQTKSGSTNIGSALTRNATATVHADVKPTVSAMSVSISGTGRDKTIGKYVQGFSKVAASFTRSAGYGASISSSSIVVRRRSGAADSQTISSNSGTTGRAVALSGLYEIRGTTRDSRGRTNTTAWATITVDAYSTPVISTFSVVRNGTTATTANATITGGHSHLGGQNPLTLKLEKRLGTGGTWTNVPLNTTATSTTATFSRTAVDTGNSVTRSYEFRLSLSDTFGARVEATRTVSTQRVVLDVHKNEGVGIGKIHEQGVLDVDGDAYFKGRIIADRTAVYYPQVNQWGIDDYNDITTEWSLIEGDGMKNKPPNIRDDLGSSGRFVYLNTMHYSDNYKKQIAYGYTSNQVWTRYSYNGNWSAWVEIGGLSGSNSNGRWYRMADGLQICIMYVTPDRRSSNYFTRTFPVEFVGDVTLAHSVRHGSDAGYNASNRSLLVTSNESSQNTQCYYQFSTTTNTGYDWWLRIVAIGRWK